MKKNIHLCLLLTLVLVLAGCQREEEQSSAPEELEDTVEVSIDRNESEDEQEDEDDAQAVEQKRYEKIPQIKTVDTYISIEEAAAGYDASIITDELISEVSLPEATVSDLPYWKGFILENKIFTSTFPDDDRWAILPEGEASIQYWYEGEIELIAQEGFNCARCLYALSFLGNPDDPLSISENALAELDALISWGLKYNVHIMISITGVPDMYKAGIEEENVLSNPAILADPYYNDLYYRYMTMLAARYQGIPASVLSFELLAEPAYTDWDNRMEEYSTAMLPTVEEIHRIDPDRILIANDIAGQVCESLAEAGCALSLHAHAHGLNTNWLANFGVHGTINYPGTFIPFVWCDRNGSLTLLKDDGFSDCTLRVYHEGYANGIEVSADGTVIYQDGRTMDSSSDRGVKEVALPEGCSSVTITPIGDNFFFRCLELEHGGVKTEFPAVLNRAASDYSDVPEYDLPTITLDDNYIVIDNDPYGAEFTSELFYEAHVAYPKSVAEKYNVGFLLTEICGDNEIPLEDYLAFEKVETGFVKEHQIPWMWNCIENVIAPEKRIWPTTFEHELRETQYEHIYIDDVIMDYIKTLQ